MFYRLATIALLAVATSPAFATDSAIESVFAAVDLTSVTGFIGGAGATIVGIALALKGIGLAKRLVGKA